MATSISRTSDGRVNCFLANFTGLRGGSNPVQTTLNDVEITVRSGHAPDGFFLPFLGEVQPVAGIRHGESTTYKLPAISKGGVFWYEPSAVESSSAK